MTITADAPAANASAGRSGSPSATVLGLAGHMMNSVILAAVFGLVVPRFVSGAWPLLFGGMLYGAVVFAVMWFVVVPLVDPLMHNLNVLVFLLGHLMWGAALGLLWARFGAPAEPSSQRPVTA